MNEDAIYLGKLYTKDQLIQMYADLKRKIEAIKLFIQRYNDCECLVCHKDLNWCGCYYDYAEAYLEEIEKIIKMR